MQIKTETKFATFPQSIRFIYFVCHVIHTIKEDVNENERNTIEMKRQGKIYRRDFVVRKSQELERLMTETEISPLL